MLDAQMYRGIIHFKDCKFIEFAKGENGNVQMKFVRDDKFASIIMWLEMSRDDFKDFAKKVKEADEK